MPPIPRSRLVLSWAKQSSMSRCTIRNVTSHAPSPIERLKGQKIRGEAGTQRRKHDRTVQTTPQHTFENEKNRGCRHVSVVAENLPLVTQRPLLQFERRFDGIEHFCAARMTDELRRLQTCRLYEASHRSRHSLLDKSWQRPREHDPKTYGIDHPAHDIERARPSMLGDRSNTCTPLPGLGPQNHRCCSIAEQSR